MDFYRRWSGGAVIKLLTAVACATLAATVTERSARAADPDKVEWSADWGHMPSWEIAGTFSLIAVDATIAIVPKPPSRARFDGGILFDDWVRNGLRGGTANAQSTAQTWSTWLFKGAVFVPIVMDDYLAALSIHENGEVAVQMAAIHLESYAVAGLVSVSASKFVGRARPFVQSCGPDGVMRDPAGRVLHSCDPSGNESFFSGHAAAAASAAGLVCVDHQHLPLFGGGVADLAPCLVMIGVAGATGVLRIVADDHWTSDVVVGWVVGAASGYVLPSLLHYGFGRGRPLGEVRAGSLHMLPTLLPAEGGAAVGFVGTF